MRSQKLVTKLTHLLLNKHFNRFIIFLICASVIAVSIETLPNNSDSTNRWLFAFECLVVATFTLEYLIRLYLSESKLRFALSISGLVDLISILPFFLGLALDLRSLRLLRMVRLLRIAKLSRYSKSIDRVFGALKIAKDDLLVSTAMLLVVMYFAALSIYHFEHAAQPDKFSNLFESMWWAVSTITTVGYGDVYPITVGGKIFTFIFMLLSMGLVAIPTGIFATALLSLRTSKHD